MLQREGNICAQEVVQVRSQHSRYAIPPFLAFYPQEKRRKSAEELWEPVAVLNFTSLLLCREPPSRASSCYHGDCSGWKRRGRELHFGAWGKWVSSPRHWNTRPASLRINRYLENRSLSSKAQGKPDGNLENKNLEEKFKRNFLHRGCLWLCVHFSWHPNWPTEHLPHLASGSCSCATSSAVAV